MTHFIFVYGTLQRGEVQDIANLEPQPRYIGEGQVRGWLYDLGHCPALILAADAPWVRGEVYEIDDSLFRALDDWEAACGDFTLASVTVQLDQDASGPLSPPQALQCDIYQGAPAVRGAPLVANSRWHRQVA